jgi:hypothetical protein
MKQQCAGIRLEEAEKPISKSFADRVSRKLWHLDSKTLISQAQRRTGLEDFGDPPIEPALSILTNSLEREARLHPLGRFLMHGHLLNILEMRLRLAAIWREQAASLTTPI